MDYLVCLQGTWDVLSGQLRVVERKPRHECVPRKPIIG